MQIRPTNSIQTTQALNLQTRNTAEKTGQALPVDKLEISNEARMLETQGATDVRSDRIAELRAQIAQGEYDTPEKMEVALTRMFDEMA